MVNLLQGNCLDLMKDIPEKSIDLVLSDPPYGTLAQGYRGKKASWDNLLKLEELFDAYKRIIKDDGIICLFGIQPFTSDLIYFGKELYRYQWIWEKDTATGFLNANYKPLCQTEDIVVFSKATVGSKSSTPIRYYPQGIIEVDVVKRNNPNSKFRERTGELSLNNVLNSDKEYIQKYTNYPVNILKFDRDSEHLHPTQKPVALLEYLIKTYTKEGETVLDNTMGSGSTGVACVNTNRHFIGMELEDKYFQIASDRINETIEEKENSLW